MPAPASNRAPKLPVVSTIFALDTPAPLSDEAADTPKNSTSKLNATVSSKPCFSPAAKPTPIKIPSSVISTPRASRRLTGRRPAVERGSGRRLVSAFKPSITMTPNAKPEMVANGNLRCMTSGKSSVASAAKTTPAAKCWKPLRTAGPGGLMDAMLPPAKTAIAGIAAYASTLRGENIVNLIYWGVPEITVRQRISFFDKDSSDRRFS